MKVCCLFGGKGWLTHCLATPGLLINMIFQDYNRSCLNKYLKNGKYFSACLLFALGSFLSPYVADKEESWECFYKYIEQCCFSYFLCVQCVNRGHFAVVALSDCQEAIAAWWNLFVHWIWRSYMKFFCSRHLE